MTHDPLDQPALRIRRAKSCAGEEGVVAVKGSGTDRGKKLLDIQSVLSLQDFRAL